MAEAKKLQDLNDIMNGQDDFRHRSKDQRRELEHLERVAADSWYRRGVSARMVEYSFRFFSAEIYIIARHPAGKNL